MAFEITVHALLLKVISEYPVSFTIERLSDRNRVLVEQLFLFFTSKNSKLIWSPV
jgi:hypothetical protein